MFKILKTIIKDKDVATSARIVHYRSAVDN